MLEALGLLGFLIPVLAFGSSTPKLPPAPEKPREDQIALAEAQAIEANRRRRGRRAAILGGRMGNPMQDENPTGATPAAVTGKQQLGG